MMKFVCVCVFVQVFYCDSVCDPAEDSVCYSLPVTGCCAAVFLPSQAARLAVIHSDGLFRNKTLSVFDLTMKESKNKREPQGRSSKYTVSFVVGLVKGVPQG